MALELFYTFNNQDSKDYSEKGLNGTNTNMTWTAGDVGYNAVFNAVNDAISHGTFNVLGSQTEVSFYLRIKFASTTGTKYIVFKQGQYYATYDGTTFVFYIVGATGTASVSTAVSNGIYYQFHINYIHDGVANDMSLYTDGTLTTSTSTQGALVSNTNIAYLGGDAGLGLADTANFEMSEYKIFSNKLSSLNITTHVNNINGLKLKVSRGVYFLGDILCSKINETNKGFAIVTYASGNDVRIQPLNSYILSSDSFVRVGHLWDTTRQYSVQLTSTGVKFFNGVSLSTQAFTDSKLVKSDTISSNEVYDYGTLTGGINNYDVPNNNFISINAGASASITGIVSKSYARRIVLINRNSSNAIRLYNNSGSSTTANRFDITADYDIAANKSVEIFYDTLASRWRIIKE